MAYLKYIVNTTTADVLVTHGIDTQNVPPSAPDVDEKMYHSSVEKW